MKYRLLTWDQDITWQYDAACLGLVARTGDDPFFHPDTPRPPGKGSRVRQAKAFCAICKVKQECLRFALDNDCTGIFGGTTERERAKMLKEGKIKKNDSRPDV